MTHRRSTSELEAPRVQMRGRDTNRTPKWNSLGGPQGPHPGSDEAAGGSYMKRGRAPLRVLRSPYVGQARLEPGMVWPKVRGIHGSARSADQQIVLKSGGGTLDLQILVPGTTQRVG